MENMAIDENAKQKPERVSGLVGALLSMAASAILGGMLTHGCVSENYKSELHQLKRDVLHERVNLYLNEWGRRGNEGQEVDHEALAKQYGIPLNNEGNIDYGALQKTMFGISESIFRGQTQRAVR